MFPVSDAYKAAMQKPAKTWDITIDITLTTMEHLSINKRDIVLGSVKYVESSTCTDTIQVGSAFANGFDFALLNRDGKYSQYDFKDAKVEPRVGLLVNAVDEFEYIPLGTFYVLESPKKLSTITLSCLDSMCRANVPFDFFDTTYPIDVADLVLKVCEKCSFNIDPTFEAELRDLNLSVHSFETSTITCRDLIASAGALLAKNVRFNRYGVLEAFWYTNSSGETTSSTRMGQSSYDDYEVLVTKVIISDNYGQAYALGDDGYEIEILNNPFIQNSEIAERTLTLILARLSTLSYRVCSVTTVGDPAYQAGDIVTHDRSNFVNYTVPVMRIVYNFGGSMSLETLGTISEVQQQQSLMDRKLINLSDKNNKDFRELESRIEQSANSIRLEVSETYATQTQLNEKVSTEVQLVSDEFVVRVSKVQDEVSGVKSDVQDLDNEFQQKYEQLTTTFQVTTEGAIIGREGSQKRVVINDSSVQIEVNGQAVSYFSEKGANMPEATVDVLHIGNITIKYNANDGHVTFS